MSILENNLIKSIVDNEVFNPWVGTPFESYKELNNIQKGNIGEKIVKAYMSNKGHNVREHHVRTDGYDLIIDEIKTEVKFSLAQTDTKRKCIKHDTFIINHVSNCKDWDRLIFLGINLDESYYCKYFTKEEFNKQFKDKYFSRQQGGNSSGNDDYMCSGVNVIEMLKEMKDVLKW